MDIYKVIKEPHITEKGTIQKELNNQMVFKVHPKANKVEIRLAVETLFNRSLENSGIDDISLLVIHVPDSAEGPRS